jgi:hypothetical protein
MESSSVPAQKHSNAKYIWTEFEVKSVPHWFHLFIFIGPVLILLGYAKIKTGKAKAVIFIIEPLLIGYFGYVLVITLFFFSNPLIGGYIAMTAYFLLAIAWVTDLSLNIRSRIRGLPEIALN